jgi:hypothetical protein
VPGGGPSLDRGLVVEKSSECQSCWWDARGAGLSGPEEGLEHRRKRGLWEGGGVEFKTKAVHVLLPTI